MKKSAFFISTLLLISVLLLQNTFAQDSSQWHLPDGVVARLGKGSIIDIKYAPDGAHFAAASTIGIWLYDAHTYKETALLTGTYVGRGFCDKPSPQMAKRLRLRVGMTRFGYGMSIRVNSVLH